MMRVIRVLLLVGALLWTRPALAADPYMPPIGPIQTWGVEVFSLVMEAHLWCSAAQGQFETCDGDNRWLGAPWTVPRPDGKRCAYYSLCQNQKRRIWAIYNALSSFVGCEILDVVAWRIPDPAYPLSCDGLQQQFGTFTGQ